MWLDSNEHSTKATALQAGKLPLLNTSEVAEAEVESASSRSQTECLTIRPLRCKEAPVRSLIHRASHPVAPTAVGSALRDIGCPRCRGFS